MTGDPLYVDRESIQPRAFAVRQLIIQEVKFRKAQPLEAAELDRLVRVARGVDVEYETATRSFVVRCEGTEVRRLPLDAITLYARSDNASASQRREADPRHWDSALQENRRLIAMLVGELAAALAPRGAA